MRCYFLLSILVCACSSTSSLPKDILSEQKMENVLYDVILADEMVDFLKFSDSTYNQFSRRTALYDTIFGLHGIKKEAFQKSLRFYQGRPDLLKGIMDDLQKKVVDTASKASKPVKLM